VVSAGKRVLVVGTGSVGIRHIENLLELDAEVSIVSMRSGRVGELAKRYPVKPYDDLQEALGTKPDAVVIANRTDQHIATALPVAACGIDIFMEKPLSNNLEGIEELSHLAREKGIIVETGYMMRFHPNLIQIMKLLAEGAVGKAYFARTISPRLARRSRLSQLLQCTSGPWRWCCL